MMVAFSHPGSTFKLNRASFNTVFCDGSVHALTYAISLPAHGALCLPRSARPK
jgi:prepilin-type processing-associated H-X9-DG protein